MIQKEEDDDDEVLSKSIFDLAKDNINSKDLQSKDAPTDTTDTTANKRASRKRIKKENNEIAKKEPNDDDELLNKRGSVTDEKTKRSTSLESVVSSCSTKRTRSHSPSKQNNYCLLGSKLTDRQTKQLNAMANRLGATVTNDWNDNVTHIIVSLIDEKKMITTRTIKYLQGLAGKKLISKLDIIYNVILMIFQATNGLFQQNGWKLV